MDRTEYLNGINKSLDNASELYDDAEILFKLKRYPRAYTLYQLSIEEIGKVSIIYNFLLFRNIQNISEKKRLFGNLQTTNQKRKVQ
jgi:AbiV family abortive infection protein